MLNNNILPYKNSVPGFEKRFKYSYYKFKTVNLAHTVVKSPIYPPTSARVKKFNSLLLYPLSFADTLPQ